MRRKENEAHHFQPIEPNKGTDTCLAYFPYACESNSAAPLSWETERSSLIYTDVKRRQMFVQFNWFWAEVNWFALHNSKLLKINIFALRMAKRNVIKQQKRIVKQQKQQQIIRRTCNWESLLLSGRDLLDLVFFSSISKQYQNCEIAKAILKGENS